MSGDTSPGSRIGAYDIIASLGHGGMGGVYRARDTQLGRDVALKMLPASFTGDPERVARLRREAQVLASLNHPHIAQIYGLQESNGTNVRSTSAARLLTVHAPLRRRCPRRNHINAAA